MYFLSIVQQFCVKSGFWKPRQLVFLVAGVHKVSLYDGQPWRLVTRVALTWKFLSKMRFCVFRGNFLSLIVNIWYFFFQLIAGAFTWGALLRLRHV